VPLTRSGGTVMFYGVTEPEDLDALRGDRTVHKIIIECWQK
jgi:hypothetical protein